ncbi:MAG TPA: efflux RND transporter periplasmic adaptor subunit [Verrucomicrobiae bacterium]|jgi:membrane fusion protein (multidrug efflux system)
MKRKLLIGLILVVAVGGGLGIVKTFQIRSLIAAGAAFVPPPETVATAVARMDKWQDNLPAVGSVNPSQGVTVAPEIAGTVSEIAFESGATVNQGDLLVKLDTSSEEAQLRAAEAQADWAKVSAERTRKLRADNTASQSELDQAEAALKQASANADNIRATIGKKTIRAPFAGRLGIRLVNLGEQLDAGKGIVSLESLSPLFVDFSLPQQELAQLQTGLVVRAVSDAYDGQIFTGELTAINPALDASLRSVRVRATFANTKELLRAGMFVRVKVELPGEQSVLVIPSTAVLSAPYGDSVFIVEPHIDKGMTNLVVEQKFIRTGRALGDFISVETGLKAGDRVVTAGIFKLRKGMSVLENNATTPEASQTPTPPNS